MRVLACVLPELRLHLAGLAEKAAAVVSVRETKSELLGNMRLAEVSAKARALGIAPGDTVAHARATLAILDVALVQEQDVVTALKRTCESLLSCAASVGYALTPHPTVFLDVTGCGHLFGGEQALIERVQRQERASVCALGESARLAQMLACSGFSGIATSEHVKALPISALQAVIGDRPVAVCEQLGLHRFADLQKLPKASLAHRLGPHAQEALALIWGVDRKPFVVYVPEEFPEETLELEDDIHTSEPLLFVLRPLLEKLLQRVQGRGLGILALELSLKTRAGEHAVVIELPSVLNKVEDLWSVLKARLERWNLPSPARALRLVAKDMGRLALHSEALFDAKPKGNFPRILAELVSDLGAARVGKLDQVDTWNMEARSVLIPFQEKTKRSGQRLPVEPLHIQAERHGGELVLQRHLIRLEQVEWWKAKRTESSDVFLAWEGERLCVVKKTAGKTSVFGVVD